MAKPKNETETKPAAAELRTMRLPVPLTEAELAVRAQELASCEAEMDDAEKRLTRFTEAAKSGKKDLETEISDHRHQVHTLAEVVRTKREQREVPVVEESDFEAGAVHTVRTDTGEVVATRGMTESERQRSLFRSQERGA